MNYDTKPCANNLSKSHPITDFMGGKLTSLGVLYYIKFVLRDQQEYAD